MLTLTIDPTRRRPLNPLWNFGGNTCHAPLLLRNDLCRQLERVKKDLGFRYVRCHGWLNDDMGSAGPVLRTDGTYDFKKIDAALDNLLGIGLKPFLEFSGMPGALASNEKTITRYQMRTAPPKDWSAWGDLIHALVCHLQDRYGTAELEEWFFEVWNEPDIPFWSGTRQEYFKLYDLSAAAVKLVNPAFRIGGPATARTAWIEEFLAHLDEPSRNFPDAAVSRCDFISTHAYPSDLPFLDSAKGDVTLQESAVMQRLYSAVRQKVDAARGTTFPIICGEWNSSAGPLAENHDECNNAAFVLKTMTELSPLCQGSLYWNISDIYEECGFHHQPFHGGYGLLTVNDLPKASYHAFALLNRQFKEQVNINWDKTQSGAGCIASTDGQTIRVLLYNYREPGATPADLIVQLRTPLGIIQQSAETQFVMPGRGSAYETWVEAGRPEFIDRSTFDRLEAASNPLQHPIDLKDHRITVPAGCIAEVEFALPKSSA